MFKTDKPQEKSAAVGRLQFLDQFIFLKMSFISVSPLTLEK